jgi:hypothetical protein
MNLKRWLAVVAGGVIAAGCVSYRPVALREGQFARGAVQVGEDVRVETRTGEELAFKVTAVENGALSGDEGERVVPGDFRSLEVRRMDRVKTIVLVSVLGGVLGTAYIVDELDDCDEYDYFCADP